MIMQTQQLMPKCQRNYGNWVNSGEYLEAVIRRIIKNTGVFKWNLQSFQEQLFSQNTSIVAASVYWEPYQSSKMELFAKMANN